MPLLEQMICFLESSRMTKTKQFILVRLGFLDCKLSEIKDLHSILNWTPSVRKSLFVIFPFLCLKYIHARFALYLSLSSQFFETQPNEICSHLSDKASKGSFLMLDKLPNHSNEGKGKEKKKERGEGKEEKRKKQWLHS